MNGQRSALVSGAGAPGAAHARRGAAGAGLRSVFFRARNAQADSGLLRCLRRGLMDR